MSLRQLNATYVAEEDRVIFRVTTMAGEEYRLWLTRARVAELLELTQRVHVAQWEQAHLQSQAKAIAEFQHEAIKMNTQFSSFEPAPRLPLGAEPVLVRRIGAEIRGEGVALELSLSHNRALTLKLDEKLLVKVRLLLEQIAQKAAWRLTPQESLAPEGAPSVAASTKPGAPDGGGTVH